MIVRTIGCIVASRRRSVRWLRSHRSLEARRGTRKRGLQQERKVEPSARPFAREGENAGAEGLQLAGSQVSAAKGHPALPLSLLLLLLLPPAPACVSRVPCASALLDGCAPRAWGTLPRRDGRRREREARSARTGRAGSASLRSSPSGRVRLQRCCGALTGCGAKRTQVRSCDVAAWRLDVLEKITDL